MFKTLSLWSLWLRGFIANDIIKCSFKLSHSLFLIDFHLHDDQVWQKLFTELVDDKQMSHVTWYCLTHHKIYLSSFSGKFILFSSVTYKLEISTLIKIKPIHWLHVLFDTTNSKIHPCNYYQTTNIPGGCWSHSFMRILLHIQIVT